MGFDSAAATDARRGLRRGRCKRRTRRGLRLGHRARRV